ncbi:MAG: DUF2878 domain-containing protein [Rhodanobacteraceae bacterium]|nr:MAG: DUF2878 domain-containing protein [Rhodanobacteraceae bacterium]
MNFWLTFVGYEAVWFAAVIGAGRDLAWPGAAATVLFAAWRLGVSRHRGLELSIAGVALLLGVLFDAMLVWAGVAQYAAPWPSPLVPAWLTVLWAAFALTIVPLFGYLHERLVLAAVFGAIGGPLAYLGAAHGWHAVALPAPAWHGLAALAIGWGVAMPLLCWLAGQGLHRHAAVSAGSRSAA